ncbi:MAG: hypothetical protein WKF37_25360 [Bryobacteraceae bacterium]
MLGAEPQVRLSAQPQAGKGAVIGSLVGAAAGAAIQVLLQGKGQYSCQSVLTFRLDDVMKLQATPETLG